MEDFRVCHSFLSRTCVRGPKRDSRPALQKCIPMMSCVSGSEETFVTYVGGFHFIFLVHSHDNEKAAKLQ